MSDYRATLDALQNLIDPALAELAEAVSAKTGQSPLVVLSDLELIDGPQIAAQLAVRLGLERYDPAARPPEPSPLMLLDKEFARDHSCVPVAFDAGHLLLAMIDPLDMAVRRQIEELAGCPVRPLIATAADLEVAFARWEMRHEEILRPVVPCTTGLTLPTVVFVGYPDGVGVTSVIWNLASVLARSHSVLLVSIGGPAEYGGILMEISRLRAWLTVVSDAALMPGRLADLRERAQRGGVPRFDLALVEVDRPTFAVDAQQVATWACTVMLVTDPEHAGLSWELIEQMYRGVPAQGVSLGIIMNRVRSPELADVGMAALDAAVRAGGLGSAVAVWAAGSIPYAPDAFLRAEMEGSPLVKVMPRHPIAREFREIARRLVDRVALGG